MKSFIFIVGIASVLSCGGSEATLDEDLVVRAENIIISAGVSVSELGFNKAHAVATLDETKKVLARNVLISVAVNKLTNEDLQSVLDKEIAVDLATNLIGTWTIINKSLNSNVDGKAGSVTFSANGTFVVNSGVFGAAGIADTGAGACDIIGTPTYEIIGGSILYVRFVAGPSQNFDATLSVISLKTNEIVLYGGSGCLGGAIFPSILTRV